MQFRNKNDPSHRITVHVMNAFALEKNGGNPAGVCMVDVEMPAVSMQKIAHEMGLSETVFVRQKSNQKYITQFFTPLREVDLCGHATIAAFSFLYQQKIITNQEIIQGTNIGELPVSIRSDGLVIMTQPLQFIRQCKTPLSLYKCLNIPSPSDQTVLEPEIISTGLPDILVPVTSRADLSSIQPDLNKMAELLEWEQAASIHAFTLETPSSITAYCRNFAPQLGISEEAATGTASGALAVYLHRHLSFPPAQTHRFVFEQGHEMHRPSMIQAELSPSNDNITFVKIGGTAIHNPSGTRNFTI